MDLEKNVKTDRDRLINTGVGNVYFLLILLLFTIIGLLFVTNTLPAYDPSILAMPHWLAYLEYLLVAVSGLATFTSFILRDKIKALGVQFYALVFHTVSIYATALSALIYGGFQSIFILTFGITVGAMHTFRLFYLRRELINAPAKRRIGEEVHLPTPQDNIPESKGDLVLQTLLLLQSRNEDLERQLNNA